MSDGRGDAGPAPMEGHGAYNRNAAVQAAGLAGALPMLEAAAAAVPLTGDGAVVIADYGCAQGRNSLVPMQLAIDGVRRRVGAARPIVVMHTDVAGSDFATLFELLDRDPHSYLRDDAVVYPAAVGRSFYGPVLPPASVTLGWSSWAVQWLSRAPGPIPDQVQAAFSNDGAVRAAYAAQAASDWQTFLTHRARELVTGGRLVVVTMGLDADGSFGYRPLLAALYEAVVALAADSLIGHDEVAAMAIPTVGRGVAELAAPFAATGSFAGLSLECCEVFLGDDRIFDDYQRDGDADGFGARWAAFSRASVFPTLALGLAGGQGDPRAASFMDRLEVGLAARMAAAPAAMTIPLARLMVAKTGG